MLWSFADSHDKTVRLAVLGLFLLEWVAVVLNNSLYIRAWSRCRARAGVGAARASLTRPRSPGRVRSFNLQAPAADPVRLLGQPGDGSPVTGGYDHAGYMAAAPDSPAAVPNVSTADLAMFWQQRAEDLQDRLYRLEEEGERGLRQGGRPGEDYAVRVPPSQPFSATPRGSPPPPLSPAFTPQVVEERLRQEQQRAQAAHTKVHAAVEVVETLPSALTGTARPRQLDEAEKRRQGLQEEVSWLREELQRARDEAEESAARAEQAALQRDRYEALLVREQQSQSPAVGAQGAMVPR